MNDICLICEIVISFLFYQLAFSLIRIWACWL